MDTATLVIVDAVLKAGSIRAAARALARPPASVAAAMARLEAALAVPLARKAGATLMLTLEGTRLAPRLAEIVDHIGVLFAQAEVSGAAALSLRPVSIGALARLVAVIEAGSIRAAARRLGLGQPQLTRQIAHLEAQLGFAMLERRRDGAAATAKGLSALGCIRRIGTLWGALADASTERFHRTEKVVRIGSVIPLGAASRMARLLADLAARWRVVYPRQPLFIASMIAEDLLGGMRRGLFDVVFLDIETLPPDLEGKMLSSSPLALVGGDRNGEDIAATLQRLPVAVPSLRSGLRQKIDHVLGDLFGPEGDRGLEIVEVDSIPVIINMVEHHGFVSILPSASLEPMSRERLCPVALDERYSLLLWIAWQKAGGGRTVSRQVMEMIR